MEVTSLSSAELNSRIIGALLKKTLSLQEVCVQSLLAGLPVMRDPDLGNFVDTWA